MEDLTKVPNESLEVNAENVSPQNEEVNNTTTFPDEMVEEKTIENEETATPIAEELVMQQEETVSESEPIENEEAVAPIVEELVMQQEEETVSESESMHISEEKEQPTEDKFEQVETEIVEEEPISSEKQEEELVNETNIAAADETTETHEKAPFSETSSKMSDVEIQALESLDAEREEDEIVEEEITENYLTYTREQLLEAIEGAIIQQVEAVKNKIGLIKVTFYSKTNEIRKALEEKFLAEGGVKEDFQYTIDAVEEQFKKALNTYREKRQKYLEDIERARQENLNKKMAILDELKALVNSEETLKKTYDEFKNIQDRWREIGAVPRAEINNLWRNYHFLIEKFFDKVKINRELKMLDLRKNLEQKMELCEKAEELLLEPSIIEATKKLQSYREKWREVGPVPSEKNEEIWERFSTAAEQIDMRKKEYYSGMREEFERNLLAKTSLCEKAEELLTKEMNSINEWNKITTEFDELLKLWKTIGNAPKSSNNEIWERFKSNLDIFFTNKKEYFDKLKEEQNNNYNLKMDICKQAEEIAKGRTDWKRATGELLTLQKQWKETGSISRKLSDKLWSRFRASCDEFFRQKEAFFADAKSSESENLTKKEDILKRLKEYQFTENNNDNLQIIKEFQREWMEIGYVPMTEKDRIQNEFRTIVNQLFERLKISVQEAQKQNYRTRLENLSGKASNFVSREKNDIHEKIQKLKSNLQLWENNIGFLSHSKQADILKQEFERKMQSARNEIALLEMKVKMILEAKNDSKDVAKNDTGKGKATNHEAVKKDEVKAEKVEEVAAVEEKVAEAPIEAATQAVADEVINDALSEEVSAEATEESQAADETAKVE